MIEKILCSFLASFIVGASSAIIIYAGVKLFHYVEAHWDIFYKLVNPYTLSGFFISLCVFITLMMVPDSHE